MAKIPEYLKAKEDVVENLEAIRFSLNRCIQEGMIDENADHYNELLVLLDEAYISEGWDDLLEVITKAKTLEVDVAAWLSRHGRASVSLPWPKKH